MEREVPERLGGRALIAPCEERCLIKFNADQPASALEGEKARVRAGVGVQNQPAPAAPREVTHGNRANAACKRTTWVELEYGVRETESVPGGHAGEAKQRVRRPRDVSEVAIGDEVEHRSPIRCHVEPGRRISWVASLEISRHFPTAEDGQQQGEPTDRVSHFHDPLLVQKACFCHSAPGCEIRRGALRMRSGLRGCEAMALLTPRMRGPRCDSARATVKYCADATPLTPHHDRRKRTRGWRDTLDGLPRWIQAMRAPSLLMLCAVTLAVAPLGAQSAAPRPGPLDARLLSPLVWRNVGPFRGGRVSAVSGV